LEVFPSAFRLGVSQLHALARLVANPRVRDSLADAQGVLVGAGRGLEFAEFAGLLADWERMVDVDGSAVSLERAHRERDATAAVVGERTFFDARSANTQGAFVKEVFDAYCETEFMADWQAGVAVHGEAMHRGLLVRSDGQRRFDGFYAMVRAAAAARADSGEGAPTVNLLWTQAGFEHELARALGGDPTLSDPLPVHVCRTTSGVPVDSRDALIATLIGQVRRVVVDSAGVIVNMGRRQRLFTGAVRDAILALQPWCMWTGCRARSRQVDHLLPWARGGLTDTANAGGVCGHHNRWRTRGYRTCRGPDGEWHHYRPDGTEIGWRDGHLTRLRPPAA
jgi:hypothetical protein